MPSGLAFRRFLPGKKTEDHKFTPADEETLAIFAAQAALAISNARRYKEEQQTRLRLETLIDTCPIGVVVFDVGTGEPISFNREAARILEGLLTEDNPPKKLLRLMTVRRADGRELPLQEVTVAQALRQGETVRYEEMTFLVPEGRSVTVLMNATPIHSNGGDLESYVIMFQDLKPLEELEILRADLLATVSHELRMPLAAIKGSATTALSGLSSIQLSETAQFFRIIDQQADQMSELITDLLDVARIESGTLKVDQVPVSPTDLVEQARTAVISGTGASNIRIELESGLPVVMADRRRIVQVLENLLSNAVRHTSETATINLTLKREGIHVVFAVADKGKGLSPDRLPDLFNRFSRLNERKSSNESDGQGLGWSSAGVSSKRMVDAFGLTAKVWAWGRPSALRYRSARSRVPLS